jgi:hypothetical protein
MNQFIQINIFRKPILFEYKKFPESNQLFDESKTG